MQLAIGKLYWTGEIYFVLLDYEVFEFTTSLLLLHLLLVKLQVGLEHVCILLKFLQLHKP